MRNLELPGRSPVHSTHGMAATSNPLASQAAIEVLRRGGNAMDAAVAACAVQCVVEPESTGVGGDCFCIYAPEGSEDIVCYNGSGCAPHAATAEWYLDHGITEIERQSPHAVTIPGAVDAWQTLVEDHGAMSLGELLQPAIAYAHEGYPIGSRVAADFSDQLATLLDDETAARIYLKNGNPPAVGSLQRQPELGATLEKIAREGRDGFYQGEVAEDIVSYLNSLDGLHTLEDFAACKGEYVEAISTKFRGYRIFECPPNGQGVIALLLLNIMAEFDPAGALPVNVERLQQEIEAGRLAYADRALYVADPKFSDVPVDMLLSREHAAKLRASIVGAGRPGATYSAPSHPSTVYITVVDKDRNACSFINSVYSNFGSGLVAPKSAVLLQNRGQGFVIEPGHPNCIGPGKRPLHTIIPGMVAKDGRAVMPFGVMGGEYQSFGHMQFLTRFFDYGLDLQEAIDAPRVFPVPGSSAVQVESGVPEDVCAGLRERGYRLVSPPKPIGGAQAIWIDWEENVLTGASDPRKDGCAIGY